MKKHNNRQSVAIVGCVGVPANYGGWETLVENIIEPLSDDFDITVFCSKGRYNEHLAKYRGASLAYISLDANGIQSIFYDLLALWRSRKFDHVLILGTSGCIALPFFRFLFQARYYLNIDGLEWRRDKWSAPAKMFLRASEYVGCKVAHKLIADNLVIQEYIRERYGRNSSMIAYGGDAPGDASIQIVQKARGDFSFSVCRIEPENNIQIILEAFSALPEENLIIVGNWESSVYGQRLRARFKVFQNIKLLDPIYEREKLDQLRSSCALYIHGHSAGGTNPSLVEAMWLGLPIVAFDVNFNRATTEDKCLYFRCREDLMDCITSISSIERFEIGSSMKSIADRRYTWAQVSQEYRDLFL